MQVQAQHLQPGDILKGTRERVFCVSTGISTPKGKIEVYLNRNVGENKGWDRSALWGKYTKINIERTS